MNTFPLMLPPSGSGVIESLALAQAPFTRIAPDGTLDSGWLRFEKSPPFAGAFLLLELCPHASDAETAETIKQHQTLERMISPNRKSAGETPLVPRRTLRHR